MREEKERKEEWCLEELFYHFPQKVHTLYCFFFICDYDEDDDGGGDAYLKSSFFYLGQVKF